MIFREGSKWEFQKLSVIQKLARAEADRNGQVKYQWSFKSKISVILHKTQGMVEYSMVWLLIERERVKILIYAIWPFALLSLFVKVLYMNPKFVLFAYA